MFLLFSSCVFLEIASLVFAVSGAQGAASHSAVASNLGSGASPAFSNLGVVSRVCYYFSGSGLVCANCWWVKGSFGQGTL